MIDVSIKMSIPADKRLEVLQTIKTLLGPIRSEPGCISCYCCLDAEAEQIVIFKEEWSTSEDLASHLRSDYFSVLLGAMKLLSIEPEIRFNTITSAAGMEAVHAAREVGMQPRLKR